MSEFSMWFEQTFKQCYCEKGNLVDQKRFSELVQLVLDDEADEESRALFEEKIRTCVQSNGKFEEERDMRDCINEKLAQFKANMPNDLAQRIKNSIDL